MLTLSLQASPVAHSSVWPSLLFIFIILPFIFCGLPLMVGTLLNKRKERKNPDALRIPSYTYGLIIVIIAINTIRLLMPFLTGNLSRFSMVNTVMVTLIICGLISLLQWKKSGFYLIVLVAASSLAIIILLASFSTITIVISLICLSFGALIWYLIMKLKCSDGKSFWSHLE